MLDTDNHAVRKFDIGQTGPGGEFKAEEIANWGGPGIEEGKLDQPYGIAVDSRDRIYIADTLNNRVQIFSAEGEFLGAWDGADSADGRLVLPSSIEIDSAGNVYVTEAGAANRVRLFTEDGTFLAKWGGMGTEPGQFLTPYGLAISGSGDVYVSEGINHRVQVLRAAAMPTADLASGSAVESGDEIALSTETDGAEIYYTTDGSAPTLASSRGGRAMLTGQPGDASIVRAIAYRAGLPVSAELKAEYFLVAASSIFPESADFDKYELSGDYEDAEIELTLNGNSLTGIFNGGAELRPGTDYSVNGNTVTIARTYLAVQPVGNVALTFRFGTGPDRTLNVAVRDTTPILPGVPRLLTAAAGDSRVELEWSPAERSEGYNVYLGESENGAWTRIGSVSEAVYGYSAAGLTNGATYYFSVKSVGQAGGESESSNVLSATPIGVPEAPTGVTAAPGNGKATVSFVPPANTGGGRITGYEVRATPGNVVVAGEASPIEVGGLVNGTSYTFTVKAINAAGPGAESEASAPVVPASGGGNGNGNGGSSSNGASPLQPVPKEPSPAKAKLLINGEETDIGVVGTVRYDGRAIAEVSLDETKLAAWLDSEKADEFSVALLADADADGAAIELSGSVADLLVRHHATLEIRAERFSYKLPARQLDLDALAARLGKNASPERIVLRITASDLTDKERKRVSEAVGGRDLRLLAEPVNYSVTAAYGGKTAQAAFKGYVERTILLPEGVGRGADVAAVAIEPDGALRPVPARIVEREGRAYASIRSLTNSTYAAVSGSTVFGDLEGHWAKSEIERLASLLMIEGAGKGDIEPNREVTRAEFAAMLVRALGLKPEEGALPFADVDPASRAAAPIRAAYAQGLIGGYADGTFRSRDKLTREQAATVFARAMSLTGLRERIPSADPETALAAFADRSRAAPWASAGLADALEAGLMNGKGGSRLAPKANLTRAEAVVMIYRLLEESDLI